MWQRSQSFRGETDSSKFMTILTKGTLNIGKGSKVNLNKLERAVSAIASC